MMAMVATGGLPGNKGELPCDEESGYIKHWFVC